MTNKEEIEFMRKTRYRPGPRRLCRAREKVIKRRIIKHKGNRNKDMEIEREKEKRTRKADERKRGGQERRRVEEGRGGKIREAEEMKR